MARSFEWHEERAANLKKHGVRFEEATYQRFI
jgi:uncharacterized DUF497 family protein